MLTPIAKAKLSYPETQMKIAIDCKKTLFTVSKWVKNNHENLTKKHVIESIIKHTKLQEHELFK